jgi:hypothetical protein
MARGRSPHSALAEMQPTGPILVPCAPNVLSLPQVTISSHKINSKLQISISWNPVITSQKKKSNVPDQAHTAAGAGRTILHIDTKIDWFDLLPARWATSPSVPCAPPFRLRWRLGGGDARRWRRSRRLDYRWGHFGGGEVTRRPYFRQPLLSRREGRNMKEVIGRWLNKRDL